MAAQSGWLAPGFPLRSDRCGQAAFSAKTFTFLDRAGEEYYNIINFSLASRQPSVSAIAHYQEARCDNF